MSNFKLLLSRKYLKVLAHSYLSKNNISSIQPEDNLLVHTALGIYQGKMKFIESKELKDISEDSDTPTLIQSIYEDDLKKSDLNTFDDEISENPITITLEDVTLITSNAKIHMPFVNIFVDQIIGISVGSYSEKNS